MPAEAGIQGALIFLGSRMRGNDDWVVMQSILRATLNHCHARGGGHPEGPLGSRMHGNDDQVAIQSITARGLARARS